ncbi:YoaK family protein [Catenulispora pinisilvae]|uniref:YoaK family protein n=1 Tax=Catenulispora pinisilvae TaxID=2705253 RepID=UPI0018924E20|nr:YoaK family protein [Catenulispora pinisilvae]
MARKRKVHGTAGLIVLLTAIAGWVDSVAYVRSGSVFVANQTGNAVFLAVQIAERWVPGAHHAGIAAESDTYGPLASLFGFCVGVAVSVPPLRRTRRNGDGHAPWILLAVEALLLGSVAVLGPAPRELRLGLAAAAMGVQSVYAAGIAIRGVSTTTLTGTLVTLISTFAETPGRHARQAIMLLTLVWTAYTLGAWGGAAAGLSWSIGMVHGVAATAAGLTALAVWWDRHGQSSAAES